MSRRYVVEVEVNSIIHRDQIIASIKGAIEATGLTVRKVEPGSIQSIVDETHAIRDEIEAAS